MYPISASQIKAARALLGWSQDDLADAANVSRTTVRSVESGFIVRASNINEIAKAFESHGIEFLDDEGVRRQPEDSKAFRGADSCDKFFADVIKVIQEKGGDVICHIQSQGMLLRASGMTHRNNIERLNEVQKITNVKCLVLDTVGLPFAPPSFPIRIISEEPTPLPSSCFVYGDQWVFAYQDSRMHFVFEVVQKSTFAHKYQDYFLPRWHIAKPFTAEMKPHKIRA